VRPSFSAFQSIYLAIGVALARSLRDFPFGVRTLRSTTLVRPQYSERFRCIGPACEDSCCVGWAVPVDREAYEKYQSVAPGPLRTLLDENILPQPDAAPANFAKVRMPASMQCPFLREDRLCRIHAELGEEFLCHTCATFPRVASTIDGFAEAALSLACPEAARLVLLDPDLMKAPANGGHRLTWSDESLPARTLLPYFWPIRELVLALVRNRAYPLWQRLVLLGTLCRRLDAVARTEADRTVSAVLDDYAAAVATGALHNAMETIRADLGLQLDMVLQLAGLCRNRALVSARFIECLEAFKRGIGFAPGATMRTLIAGYSAAYRESFAPFVAAHPHILENYLINAIFRRQFPFGSKDGRLAAEPDMAREFALLATQFALIKGLLIGVAGCHKSDFSSAHVVHTVQSASKHFDHHPRFLDEMHALLVSNHRDNPHGLTMLLRN
jgi:lysine-N-methylase